jgi:uncharacterized protein (TIGR03118 family)
MTNAAQHRAGRRRSAFRPCLAAILATLSLAAAGEEGGAYLQRNLVSDGSIPAERTDPNLISPWGIATSPTGLQWIAGNGSSASTAYDGQGIPLPPSIPTVEIPGGTPTGIVGNEGSDFALSCPDGTLVPSTFIFATEGGVISAWSPRSDPANAIPVVDNSRSGAIYKGVAIAADGNRRFLYATDFHGGKVDVFDGGFKPVRLPAGAFRDPGLPAGFAPFGIQNINGSLYVTYARQDDLKEDPVPGPGQGFVNVFDPNGRLLRRLASRGALNVPWGMALAPADFGPFGNHLLVANFGDGKINAYHPATGELKGQIRDPENRPIAIDGLWGLCFGQGEHGQSGSPLFFTAGPAYENKGLYGRIERAARMLASPGKDRRERTARQDADGALDFHAPSTGERRLTDKAPGSPS